MDSQNCERKKDVLRLATFMGELMLSSGAETYRIEDSIKRVCASRGFHHVNVFIAPATLIVSDDRFDGFTFMKVIKHRSVDLNKVDLINRFSRKFVCETDMTVCEALEILKHLGNDSPYTKFQTYIATAIGSASFAILAGGNDPVTATLTLITAILAMKVNDFVTWLSKIPIFATLVTSSVIAMNGVFLTEIGILNTPKMLIVGTIMPLLPGVPFIKAVRDLISGELMSGLGRVFDAGIVAAAIASGVGIVINSYIQKGGTL
ncbi:MAG: threonine/serine exporter family protein [Peptostreptococcaceae bacterium]